MKGNIGLDAGSIRSEKELFLFLSLVIRALVSQNV